MPVGAIKIHDIPVFECAAPTDGDLKEVQPVTIKFKSKSGSDYELRLGRDGVAYCTCPAWRFSGKQGKVRTCKHIQEIERRTYADPTFTPHDGMSL